MLLICMSYTGNGLGGPGSVQRTTVTISAPRRIAPVKTEMFADEDVHYSDVENVRTEFSLGYYKDLMATSGSGARSEQVGVIFILFSKTILLLHLLCAFQFLFEFLHCRSRMLYFMFK